MSIKTLKGHQMLGAVILDATCRFYGGTVGEWSLEYVPHDPSRRPGQDFRNGLLTIDVSNAGEFCEAMAAFEVELTDVVRLVKEEQSEGLWVLVNFDERLFVSGFTEVELEERVPAGWTGLFGTPMDYLPERIKAQLQ